MTKEEIFLLAEKADLYLASDDSVIKFAKLIAEKEREEIEKRVMELDETMATRANVINKAIRARGQE